MGDHSPLPNPYASTLATDVVERSSAALYLLAGALSAGMAVAGGPAVGVAAAQDARGDTAEYVATTPVRATGDAGVIDRVGAADAEKFIDGVAARLARDRVGFEARLAALRPDIGVARATRELHGLWQPAADGIHDLATSMAEVAVWLDVAGAESPAVPEPAGLPGPEPMPSPALVAQAAAGQPSGRAVIELAGRWTDIMLVNLRDSLDMMVDRIENAWPGEPPAPGRGGTSLEYHPDRPALSLVRSVP